MKLLKLKKLKDCSSRYIKNEKWFQEWKERVALEKRFDGSTKQGQKAWREIASKGGYHYKWFPNPTHKCFSGFSNRKDQCGLFMYDWSKEPLVTVKDEKYMGKKEDLVKLFTKYAGINQTEDELFRESELNGVYKLKNPEVPVTLVYGSHLQTVKSLEWNYDPLNHTSKGEYAPPSAINMTYGDKTVPTASSLMPAFNSQRH